ncbi:MAG: diguanylate cyclase, partial [Desulfonatronovibrionaceae bacterium]
NIDEETLAEVDLYTNFLTKSYADYYHRTLHTFSKARILEYMPVAVARVSTEGKVLQVNDRFSQVFQKSQDPVNRNFWNMFKELVQMDQEKSWLNFLASDEQSFSWLFCPIEVGLEKPGIACWHLSAARIEMDGVSQILVMLQDITEISTLERDVFKQAEYLRGIINSMQDTVFTVNDQGKILFAPPKYKSDLQGRNLFELAKPTSTLGTSWGPEILESTNRPVEVNLFTGEAGRALEVIFTRLSSSASPQYLVVGRDLTVIRRLEEKIRKQATFDYLTKVFNRHQFSIFLERETQRAARKSARVGLIFFDLDMFKQFNDRYGHQRGDQALKDFGRLLIAGSRRGMDYPFRFGGDEFVLLVSEATEQVMEEIVSRIVASFEKEFEHDLSLSIGLALMNKGEDRDSFLNRADKALFKAKEKPGNTRIWAENNQERN